MTCAKEKSIQILIMATVSLIKRGSEYSGGLNSKHVRSWNGPKTKLQLGASIQNMFGIGMVQKQDYH